MNFWDRLKFVLDWKDSQARIVSTYNQAGQAVSSPENYESYARQGYSKNVLVYKAISYVARATAGIDWCLYQKRKGGKPIEIEEHPLLDLINQPNPMQARSAFMEANVGFLLISGNMFVESVKGLQSAPPVELWPMRPDRTTIRAGKNGYPQAYIYSAGGIKKEWPVDFVKMQSEILHVKTFNPLNDWYGMSPLQAAMSSVDQNNAASRWNLGLLQNSATPSGVLQMRVTDANPRGELTADQYARLRKEYYENYTGAKNAGKPMIIEGGLQWTQVSLSPKDMEFIKGKEVTSQDIAMVYGVPGELLGLGKKTFDNYSEARLSFYEETVLPLLDFIIGEYNRWLAPAFGEGLYLEYDKDDIEALIYKREKKFATVKDANFLTQNEKRESVGYEPIEGWDVFVIGNQILENPEDAQTTDPNQMPNGSETDPNNEDENATGKPNEQDATNSDGTGNPNDLNSEDGSKGWKAINLLNRNEKKQSWRRQNARRRKLQANFERDLAQDFDELKVLIVKAAGETADLKLKEFSMFKAINDFMPTIEKTLRRHIKYTLYDFGGMVIDEAKSVFNITETKANLKFDSFVKSFIDRRTATAITSIEGTTKKQVQRIVKRLVEQTISEGNPNADLTDEFLKEFDSLSEGRARTIARTEVQVASTNGALEAVKSLQIPNMKKEWVSAEDDRVRDGGEHGNDANHEVMDGVDIDLDDKFTVPPDSTMEGPGDSSASADQVCNCRCVLVYKSANRGAL